MDAKHIFPSTGIAFVADQEIRKDNHAFDLASFFVKLKILYFIKPEGKDTLLSHDFDFTLFLQLSEAAFFLLY
jgi:hypothetical protein